MITPAHLELLSLQLGAEEIGGTTMNLVIAGDTLRAEGLSRWRDHAPTTRLFNEYGPTEATVGCCSHEVGTDYRRDGVVPIGRPIANTQLYVLDSNLQVVPPGVTGELYVGGAGVARGYLNRPELTRERFLLDPFSRRAGARLYRTGDLARYCEDGTLECLGRVDDQVKVRGFRIELGEIETALLGYPGVRSCVILVREDAPENKQLVCYLVAGDSESPDANALRKFLRQRLPEYMVPVHFVFLDSLPLTRNGKIDRKALPAPSRESIRSAREFIAPRTETEKKLAAIWIKLLKVKCIGIYEDFFDLGGDSLLAVRAMVQTQELFGVAPSMQAFFPRFTIAGLAEALSSGEECRDRLAYVVPVQSRGQKPPFFWIGAATLAAALSVQLGSNQPVFSIGFEPSIIDQLKTPYRVEELAKYLVLAVREKQTHGPYHLGGFCQDGIFAIEVARQLTAAGEDVGLLALFEPLNPRHSLRAKIEAGLKRTWIRIRLRFAELRKIELGEFSQYACSRWRNLKWLVTHSLWHIHGSFQNWKRKPHPLGLERILFLAASSYKPNALACPTVIFRSKDWPISSAGDPYFGWRKLLTGRTEIDEVPGDHVGIFREPYVQALVMKLRICLEKARKQKGTY